MPLRVYDWRFKDRSTEMLYVSEDSLQDPAGKSGPPSGNISRRRRRRRVCTRRAAITRSRWPTSRGCRCKRRWQS